MGVCVPNFRFVTFFVWLGDVTQIHKYTDRWMARHVDGCRQVSRHLQPWLEFDLSGTTDASGNHTVSFRDVEPQNKLTGAH